MTDATVAAGRTPLRLSEVPNRWSCSRMSVWRVRKDDPDFPSVFHIGGRPYVFLDALEAYEAAKAASAA